MKLTLIIIGLLISLESINAMRLVDAFLLNPFARYFMAFKHVLSALSGFVIAWYAFQDNIEPDHLLFGAAIVMFILADALYRWMDMLQKNHPNWYFFLLSHINFKPRRKSDNEAFSGL